MVVYSQRVFHITKTFHNNPILVSCKLHQCYEEDSITMSESVSENQHQLLSDMYALCCCCLELPCLKSLWSEYVWMGQSEIYGHMLKECFNLTWPQYEQSKDQICEVCITQLRSALQFKQKVLQSKTRLEAKLVDLEMAVKVERLEAIEPAADETEKYTFCANTELWIPDEKNIDLLVDNVDDHHYDEADYKDGVNDDTHYIKTEQLDVQSGYLADVNEQCPQNRKKVKRKTSDKNHKGTRLSKRRIIIIPKDKKREKIEFRKVNYIKPRQNVCLILEHSTIVPFKSSKGYFTCLYCSKQHVGFDELKAHVFQSHENINFKTILKSILRPHDRVKADVSDITCKICKKRIDNLEMLVSHLTEQHNIKFNDVDAIKPVDSILAYDLSEGKYRCYICKTEFLFFKTLSNHMNTHSSDYVCDVCGRCFLLPERLRAHSQLHVDGQSVKCDICGKVCTSSALLRSHVRYTHKKLSFMCSICNETFPTYRLRMRHLEEVHKRAPLNLTCKICSKKYNTPNSLNSHMRKDHLKIQNEPKHSCNVCGMKFKSPTKLASHSIVHSGEKKFECEVCHKKYARAKSLSEHLKIHRNDRRWSCSACAQAFVQKCSLKNHIRVHHVDMDYEQLIVYKKPDVE